MNPAREPMVRGLHLGRAFRAHQNGGLGARSLAIGSVNSLDPMP
jgi:hypothetical protein